MGTGVLSRRNCKRGVNCCSYVRMKLYPFNFKLYHFFHSTSIFALQNVTCDITDYNGLRIMKGIAFQQSAYHLFWLVKFWNTTARIAHKRNLKIRFLPHSKHNVSPLRTQTSAFRDVIALYVWHHTTQIGSENNKGSSLLLNQTIHIKTTVFEDSRQKVYYRCHLLQIVPRQAMYEWRSIEALLKPIAAVERQ